ncbi:MAG: hypothetical protein Q7J32_17565 [Sphingomonadaceae bacterium]|nr:hypothetical protein [Sphingomonadaceae bacterium]
MSWLVDELDAAASAIDAPAIRRLHALGVTNAALVNAMDQIGPYPPVGIVRIEIDRGGLWQPSEHGRPAIVQPVTAGGELLDLVAWRSADPLAFHLRTGHAWALGVDNLERLYWTSAAPPLRVHPTPLAWLAAGGGGLTVLDWRSADLVELRLLERITVRSSSFARVLRDALMRPPRMPTITADSEGVRRAA